MRKIRLFIEEKNLNIASRIKVSDGDFEYLTKVMRQKISDEILVFNGADGEFIAAITQVEKRFLNLEIKEKIADLTKGHSEKPNPKITNYFSINLKNTQIFPCNKAYYSQYSRSFSAV